MFFLGKNEWVLTKKRRKKSYFSGQRQERERERERKKKRDLVQNYKTMNTFGI